MKWKQKISKFLVTQIIEAGQVEGCLGQVGHEVYLADWEVEIEIFF